MYPVRKGRVVMRPRYERDLDRANEREIIEACVRAWQVTYRPRSDYRHDAILGGLRCEVKARKSRYLTVLISESKWTHLLDGVPGLFIWRWGDGSINWARAYTPYQRVWAGRQDRHDPQDMEWCVSIPPACQHPLSVSPFRRHGPLVEAALRMGLRITKEHPRPRQ